jgi:PEP-CTERM motif
MKPSTKTLFVFGCAYAITAASSFAQLIYTFDESGNSSGPASLPPISPGVMQIDPSGGLTVPVLVYTLPLPIVAGDVVLTEPGNPSTGGQYSDVVRFWNPTGINLTQIIFYSDASAADPADSLADTGLPQQLINPVFIPEVGPEGNNGAIYTPPAGAPGSTLAGVAIQYNIISDIPEPGTMALITLGSGLLLFLLKRQSTAGTN